ncbi:MAG TPA: hypothetical protein VL069_09660 [Opitutus sp.]|nr:hypothetical protein [Opitutus sp.]
MRAFFSFRLARTFSRFISLLALAATAVAQDTPRRTAAQMETAVTRVAPRRAIVEGLAEPVQNLRLMDLQGRDISGQVEARVENGKVTLNLAQPSAVVVKSKNVQTLVVPPEGKIVLPGGALVPLSASTGTTGELPKAIWFRLTFAASPMPAPWDEEEGTYLTLLTFGLKRPDSAPPTLSLDQPVIVKLAYQGLVAPEIAMISLDAPGLENEKTIPLRFTPQSEKPTLLVRSSISDVNLELTAVPRLALFPERDAFLGLGLDTVALTVTNIQPDGRSAAVQRSTPVNVTVEGGARVETSDISFEPGESTSRFTLRSAGLGAVKIRANADGRSGTAMVRQTFPLGPLAAALIGGALGGFARRFVKGARRTSNRRRLLEGVVVGVIVFVAGILGVGYLHLPPALVATEAGAFLTAALGGFVGVSVLELMAKKNTKTASA